MINKLLRVSCVILTVMLLIVIISMLIGLSCGLENRLLSDTENSVSKLYGDYMTNVGTKYEEVLSLYYSERYNCEVKVYDSCDITWDLLESRDGCVIIERCKGRVLNSITGDGEVLDINNEGYNYISYRQCGNICGGTLMMTYFVYNPSSTYIDDIIGRYDIVVSREFED